MTEGIGNRIKKIRISRGLSQESLANKVGVTKFLICRYENESVLPSAKTLARIASALNIDLYYITDGETGKDDGTIAYYGDIFDENSLDKILPLDIPPNSNYFSIRAKENYACGIGEGDILILRPVERPTSDGTVVVEQTPARLLIGSLRANLSGLWLYQDVLRPPIDISDESKYTIIAELVYAIKDFTRR
jgi:transcriptional regulator with XRE-family HTH domain